MNTVPVRSKRDHRGIEIFSDRLRKLREGLGLGQLELAKRVKEYLGDSGQAYQSQIGNMENSNSPAMPSVQVLRALALILETNTDYLLGLTDDDRPVGNLDDQVVAVVENPEERKVVQEMVDLVASASRDDKLYIAGLVRRILPKKPRIIGD
jgi:transcriptional regulator with XRE-family HTH domain